MLRRRQLLIAGATGTTVSLAGCGSSILGTSGSATWGEAFQQETSEQSRTLLSKTPIAVTEVDSRAEVQTSLAVLGWTLGLQSTSGSPVSNLEAAVATVNELRPQLQTAVKLLDGSLSLVEEMKNTSAFGTSVWDGATRAAPQLEQFVSVAEELRSQLSATAQRLGEIKSTTQPVLTRIDEIQNTGTTKYGSLPGTVTNSEQAYEDVLNDLSDIREGVQQIISISEEARSVANEIPVMGSRVSRVYGQLAAVFKTIDELLGRFESEVQTVTGDLADAISTARSEANSRFKPISEAATGSEQRMEVMSIETDVQAYGGRADVNKGETETPTGTETVNQDTSENGERGLLSPPFTETFQSGLNGWQINHRFRTDPSEAPQNPSAGTGEYSNKYGGSVRLHVDGGPSTIGVGRRTTGIPAGTDFTATVQVEDAENEPGNISVAIFAPDGDDSPDERTTNDGAVINGETEITHTAKQEYPEGAEIRVWADVWPGEFTAYVTSIQSE